MRSLLVSLGAPAKVGRRHRLAHALYLQSSVICHETIGGTLYVGTRCLTCGLFNPWDIAAGGKP